MILAHAEERSFNAALFATAGEVLREGGHQVQDEDPIDVGRY